MYSRNIWEEENLLHLHTQITPTQMHTSFLSSAPEVLGIFLRDTVMLQVQPIWTSDKFFGMTQGHSVCYGEKYFHISSVYLFSI